MSARHCGVPPVCLPPQRQTRSRENLGSDSRDLENSAFRYGKGHFAKHRNEGFGRQDRVPNRGRRYAVAAEDISAFCWLRLGQRRRWWRRRVRPRPWRPRSRYTTRTATASSHARPPELFDDLRFCEDTQVRSSQRLTRMCLGREDLSPYFFGPAGEGAG
jgi:hypothetical protein